MISNAMITSTMLGREDHGIGNMTWMIYIKTSSFVCGIGGYQLDEYNKEAKTRVFRAESMESISELLDVVGVDKWEDLPGKYIRFEDDGWGSSITKIGNIIEDRWLDLNDFFEKGEQKKNNVELSGFIHLTEDKQEYATKKITLDEIKKEFGYIVPMVKKCDTCGKLYEYYLTENDIQHNCPECTNKFKKFMTAKLQEEKND